MKHAYLLLSIVLCVLSVPALYLGALLMGATGSYFAFPIPSVACLVLAGFAMHKAENML